MLFSVTEYKGYMYIKRKEKSCISIKFWNQIDEFIFLFLFTATFSTASYIVASVYEWRKPEWPDKNTDLRQLD